MNPNPDPTLFFTAVFYDASTFVVKLKTDVNVATYGKRSGNRSIAKTLLFFLLNIETH
jgi:hypothetical protein